MRGRQVVWSDREIQKLSREFVTVADEVYMLYPEDAYNLGRVKDEPAHLLFRRFGESMPAGAWKHPGTKQGIYMMGPDGEYLEGRAAASGDPKDILDRMQRALEKWSKLKREKKYASKPVPELGEPLPPEVVGKPMVLRVSLRDLATTDKPSATAHWRPGAFDDRQWAGFVQWAWNQNWIAFDAPAHWVPAGSGEQSVPDAMVRRLCREVLVDNVRGQAPHWRDAHIKQATLTMRRVGTGAPFVVEYRGEVTMDAGDQGYHAHLQGEAEWDTKAAAFVRFELVAVGERRGAWQFNQRDRDPGPAPMGVALRLYRR